MKIVFVFHMLPSPEATEGGGITIYEMIRCLKRAGHELTYVYLHKKSKDTVFQIDEDVRSRTYLEGLGMCGMHEFSIPVALPAPWARRSPFPLDRIVARATQAWAARDIRRVVAGRVGAAVAEAAPGLCFAFAEAIHYVPATLAVPIACWATHSGEPYREIAADLGLWKVLRSRRLARWLYPLSLRWSRRRAAQAMHKARAVIMHSNFWGRTLARHAAPGQLFWALPHPGPDARDQIGRPTPFPWAARRRTTSF